jgi:hypothetical protein
LSIFLERRAPSFYEPQARHVRADRDGEATPDTLGTTYALRLRFPYSQRRYRH